ncbi:MAG TPA: T9SS type A sorting domain-containing protein, partial [Chitinophagales bacterium]|nr:T9SS type A sorting domain-containing protein [Chitinophagales bacterium]
WANWNPNNAVYTSISDPRIISGINVYPNPMSTDTTLEVNLLVANNVNIAITDLSGRMISQVLNEQMSAGNHTINIQTPHLATGMYFVQVRTGNENRMIKLNVAE